MLGLVTYDARPDEPNRKNDTSSCNRCACCCMDFGLPYWQITQTATDANRAVLRWARALTGRKHILVFDGVQALLDHFDEFLHDLS